MSYILILSEHFICFPNIKRSPCEHASEFRIMLDKQARLWFSDFLMRVWFNHHTSRLFLNEMVAVDYGPDDKKLLFGVRLKT